MGFRDFKVDKKKQSEIDLKSILENLDLEIGNVESSYQPIISNEFKPKFLGKLYESPNPLEYPEGTMYKNTRNGVVYIKEGESWELLVEDGKNGSVGPQGQAGGSGTGIKEVQSIVETYTNLVSANMYTQINTINNSRLLSVKDFNVVGDGVVDDTINFRNAIVSADSISASLYVPKGIYRLASWSTLSIKYFNVVGDGKDLSTIQGNNTAYTHFINILSGGSLSLDSVGISLFDNAFYCNTNINNVSITNCKFLDLNNKSFYYNGFQSSFYNTSANTGNPLSECSNIIFNNNYVENCQGIHIDAGFDSAIATNNTFVNVTRNFNYWSESSNRQVYAISLGYSDNILDTIVQTRSRNAVVYGNIIKGIRNTCNSGFKTTNGIIVCVKYSIISNNSISDVSATDGTNCEAIYNKSECMLISNNVIVDGSNGSCAIALKGGQVGGYGPIGLNNLVTDNIIKCEKIDTCYGVAIYNGGYANVKNNIISGTGYSSIIVYGDTEYVSLENNKIYNCNSDRPIFFSTAQIQNAKVIGNEIINCRNTSGSLYPVRMSTAKGYLVKDAIKVISGGSGYTSYPTITVDGVVDTNPRFFFVDGSLVSYSTNVTPNPNTIPSFVISGGGGSGAQIIATGLTSGYIRNVLIENNIITTQVPSGVSEFTPFSFVCDNVNSSNIFDNVKLTNNHINLLSGSNGVVSYKKMIDFNVNNSTYYGSIGNLYVNGLYLTSPHNFQLNRYVCVNGDSNISKHWKLYNSIQINDIFLNGSRIIPNSKNAYDKNKNTFSVSFDGTSATTGSYILGTIPGNLLIDKCYCIVGTNNLKSITSAAIVSFYVKTSTDDNYRILLSNPISAYPSNSIISGVCDGSINNIKVVTQDGLNKIDVYMKITGESITSGDLKFIMYTDQYN